MTTIICPTDFTRASHHAIRYALNIAGKTNARVILLHVYEIPIVYNDMAITGFALTEPDIKGVAGKKILSLRQRLQRLNPGITIEACLKAGNASVRINELAEEKKADLIIMSATSTNAVERALIGSITSRVMNDCSCELIIVPPAGRFNDIRNIVFTTDLHGQSMKGVEKIAAFAKKFKAALTFLYVDTNLSQSAKKSADQLTEEIRSHIDYKDVTGYICTDPDVAHGIQYFIKKHAASMLCMITHHRSFLENIWNTSITKKVARHLTVPLLVLK